jgi:hypothetical protein
MSIPDFTEYEDGPEGIGFEAAFNFESSGDTDLTPSVKQFVKVVKPGFRWLWDWYNGYWVVLLGPSLAGKTRFLRYLYTQKLEDDELTETARAKARTEDVEKAGLIVLRVGKPPGVLLRFRAVVDSPGKMDGADHAKTLTDANDPRRGTHIVVVVLNGDNGSEVVRWIREFTSLSSLR